MGVERTRTTAQATAEGLRVFVAGVPWKIEEDVLRKDFEECGVIEDLFLLKDSEGWSKGRCFITFQSPAAVQAALKFDNTTYGGRTIFVKLAEEKKGGAAASSQSKPASFDTKPEGCVSLCLKHIGEATEADVMTLLEGCEIETVRVVTDKATGNARGIAFVEFASSEDVDKAMKQNGKLVKGLAVDMRYVEPKSSAPKREKPQSFPDEKPEGCTTLCLKNLGEAVVDDVWEFLDGCDVQSVRIVFDRITGHSRGIAFVDFTCTEGVDKAMQCCGKELKGCIVEMRYESVKERRPRPDGCMTVAIKKLPENATESDVQKLFKGLKSIYDLRVICDKMMACTGLAFVEFSEVADVEAAIKRDGMSVLGQTVFVCYETKQKKEREWGTATASGETWTAQPAEAKTTEKKTATKEAVPAAAAPAVAAPAERLSWDALKKKQENARKKQQKIKKGKKRKKAPADGATATEGTQKEVVVDDAPKDEQLAKKAKRIKVSAGDGEAAPCVEAAVPAAAPEVKKELTARQLKKKKKKLAAQELHGEK